MKVIASAEVKEIDKKEGKVVAVLNATIESGRNPKTYITFGTEHNINFAKLNGELTLDTDEELVTLAALESAGIDFDEEELCTAWYDQIMKVLKYKYIK